MIVMLVAHGPSAPLGVFFRRRTRAVRGSGADVVRARRAQDPDRLGYFLAMRSTIASSPGRISAIHVGTSFRDLPADADLRCPALCGRWRWFGAGGPRAAFGNCACEFAARDRDWLLLLYLFCVPLLVFLLATSRLPPLRAASVRAAALMLPGR